MYNDDRDNYAIVKYNQNTGERETLMVVRGRSRGGEVAMSCTGRLTAKDKEAGWVFYTEKTNLPANDSTG